MEPAPKPFVLNSETVALAATTHLIDSRRLMRLNSISNVSFLQFFEQVIAGAPSIGHDGERRIFVGVRYEWTAVSDKEVFHVPGLRILIQHGSFSIGAHAGRSDFMD